MNFRKWIGASVVAFGLSATSAFGATYGFDGSPNINNAGNNAIAEAQMFVSLLDGGSGKVAFKFENIGPEQATLTNVYWDDDVPILDALVFIEDRDSTGLATVDYEAGANPSNASEPNSVSPKFEASVAADPDSPKPTFGLNSGEYVTFVFSLLGGYDYLDVIDAVESSTLRMAIRVQNFENGGSETLFNETTPIPLPAAGWLLIAGLGGLAAMKRRKAA